VELQPTDFDRRPSHPHSGRDVHAAPDYYETLAAQYGYDDFAADGDLDSSGGTSHRRSQPGKAKKPKKSAQEVARELADGGESLDERFAITYTPARYETVWLTDSLRPFAENAVLRDVLALVKGGKEANVYLCEAEPATGYGLMAAKVYRPRMFRNLRNDKMYREGRELLSAMGTQIKQRNNREMRAVGKKTDFGQELTHISWLMHEYVTLQRLHSLGAATPRPIASGANALLMEYIGDRRQPAPALHAVTLGTAEARTLYAEVMRNVELMLAQGIIHGDLSAYNILYWQGKVTLIDFPQVTTAIANSNAWTILQRDVQRVNEYFALQGVPVDPSDDAATRRLWQRHVRLPIPSDGPAGQ
jgi:RIO kinase 1